jgi:hypothetical protein
MNAMYHCLCRRACKRAKQPGARSIHLNALRRTLHQGVRVLRKPGEAGHEHLERLRKDCVGRLALTGPPGDQRVLLTPDFSSWLWD